MFGPCGRIGHFVYAFLHMTASELHFAKLSDCTLLAINDTLIVKYEYDWPLIPVKCEWYLFTLQHSNCH